MKNIIIILLAGWVLVMSACQNRPDLAREKQALLQTDIAFSALSREKGMRVAFATYIDSGGMLLRPNSLPVAGAAAIASINAQGQDGFSLTWKPDSAVVSAAADLGYTYGVYTMHRFAADTVLYGTYVSIWKKQPDGQWKFVLDSGNEGIGPAAEISRKRLN